MKAIGDLYSSGILVAMGISSRRQSDGIEVSEQTGDRPWPVTLIIRIKRKLVRCASASRRLEFDTERYGMADWWLGL